LYIRDLSWAFRLNTCQAPSSGDGELALGGEPRRMQAAPVWGNRAECIAFQ
jgi:hypothetical protein